MAPEPKAYWREVTTHINAPKARSSHAVAVVGQRAFVFGGEFQPREPIDNLMHILDFASKTWSYASMAKGDIPDRRVGVTMVAVGDIIYVFGGRDKEHEELNDFLSFNTTTEEWKLLSSGDTSPPHRSYHAMAVDVEGNKIYIFGGCGKLGRLNDLWCFEIAQQRWQAFNLPPEGSRCIPRGGPGLAVVNGYVWVIYGFCGHELQDVHRYSLMTHEWEEVEVSSKKPSARSVFGTAVIGKYILIYGGEVDPSDLGHLGAGGFSSEIFVFNVEKLEWSMVESEVREGRHPGARGWYAAAAFGESMLVYGGNSESNDRLDDMYLLTLENV